MLMLHYEGECRQHTSSCMSLLHCLVKHSCLLASGSLTNFRSACCVRRCCSMLCVPSIWALSVGSALGFWGPTVLASPPP
jgi:hypothetical protein